MKNSVKKISAIAVIAVMLACCIFLLSACDLKGVAFEKNHFEKDTYYEIDYTSVNIMGMSLSNYGSLGTSLLNLILDTGETYFVFKPDGSVHGQIKTRNDVLKKINSIFSLLGLLGVEVDLDNSEPIDLEDIIASYVEPMFPGFTACLKRGDLENALLIIKRSIGLNIVGFDYDNEGVKEILGEIAQNMAVSLSMLSKLPEDLELTLTFDSRYIRKTVKGSDDKEYQAIYIGDSVANRNQQTNAFITFTENEDESLDLVVEFMNVKIKLLKLDGKPESEAPASTDSAESDGEEA